MPEMSVLHHGMQLDIERAIKLSADSFDQHQLIYGHGTADALAEASWLVLHALELSPLEEPDYSRVLTGPEIEQCDAIVCRRIRERIPAAYITGTSWFAGLPFKTDERALVPRSPLAEFILNDFFNLVDPAALNSILDLCTGGGCIGIACAVHLPHVSVDASDLSTDALKLAGDNVAAHNLQHRVNLIQSPLFENLSASYDLIISNPPYVDAQEIYQMGEEFEHEPLMGLAAGVDGLDLVRLMLHQASDFLNKNGLLVVEVGNSAEALENAYPQLPFLWLEFENGGTGIFALTREELVEHADEIDAGLIGSTSV